MSTDKTKEELKNASTEKVAGGADIVNNSDRDYQDPTQTLVDNLWPHNPQEVLDSMNLMDKTAELLQNAFEGEHNITRG